jgi:hypothetical protein
MLQHREKLLRQKFGPNLTPLTHRLGFCGIMGETVVSREYYTRLIHECEQAIDDARHAIFHGAVANSFFVIFDSQVRCHRPYVSSS